MRKNFSHWAIQIYQNEVFISSPLSGKNTVTFCNICDIFIRKQGGVKSQRNRIKIWQKLFHPHDSGSTSCKKILVQIFQFSVYRSQRTFQKNNTDFQIWLVFLVPFLHFLKPTFFTYFFSYLMQNLILTRLAPISNPKNEKPKSSYDLF